MTIYIHEPEELPRVHWIDPPLFFRLSSAVRHQGRLVGRMEAPGFDLRKAAAPRTPAEDVRKSSEIACSFSSLKRRRIDIDISGAHADALVRRAAHRHITRLPNGNASGERGAMLRPGPEFSQ